MRRYQSLGLGVVSALFCASLVGACSASGNDPTVPGGSGGATDSGAAADTSYTYEAGSVTDSGPIAKIDSGPIVPFDSGPPPPPAADCDLGGSNAATYFGDLAGGSLPACGTADACGTGQCCLNLSGAIPASFLALFGGGSLPAGGCVDE